MRKHLRDTVKSSPSKLGCVSWAPALIFCTAMLAAVAGQGQASQLESWQTCCGAVCLRTVGGLLGDRTGLAEIRELLQPNSEGESTLAEIAATARKMGFYATGFRIRNEKLQECSAPLIAHRPPQHFVVLLGLGKGEGVMVIDPPRDPKKMTEAELKKQKYWNAVAVSKHAIDTRGQRIRKLPERTTTKEKVANEYGGLRFESTAWNFGTARPGDEETYEFSFKNICGEPVTLSKVKANCACLEVVDFTEKVAPGESGAIKVLLDTEGLQGYVTKGVVGIFGNANTDKNEQFLLSVFGEVSRRGELLLRPSEIHLPDMVQESRIGKSVTLRRIGYDRLFLEEVKPCSPAVSAKITGAPQTDLYEAQIDLEIAGEGKLGPFEHEVVFETGYAEYRTAKLRIHGNIVSHISVEPPEVFLGILPQQGHLQKTINVRSTTATPFSIKAAKSSVDNTVSTAFRANEGGTLWQVKLVNTTTLATGMMRGRILLEIDDRDVPEIQIPFVGLVLDDKAGNDV